MQHLLEPQHEHWQRLIAKRAKLIKQLRQVETELAKRPAISPQKEVLSAEEVEKYRLAYKSGVQTMTGLAKQAGVHKSTMSRLLRFKTHKSS